MFPGLAHGAERPVKELYLSRCSRCHKLYDPRDYDAARWDYWMEKMKKKARLNDPQYQAIRRYAESLRES